MVSLAVMVQHPLRDVESGLMDKVESVFPVSTFRAAENPYLPGTIENVTSGLCKDRAENEATMIHCMAQNTYCPRAIRAVKRTLCPNDLLLMLTEEWPTSKGMGAAYIGEEGFEVALVYIGTKRKEKLEAVTLHEVGHLLGLKHCTDKKCLMFESAMSTKLCKSCQNKVERVKVEVNKKLLCAVKPRRRGSK